MDYRSKQLEQELFALNKVFAELGLRLSEVAREMAAPGVMPPEKLQEQISAARTSFETVRSAVHGHAGVMLVSPLPKMGDLVSIAMIDSLLKAAALAEATKYTIEDEHQQALGILDRALSITHRESSDFKPLLDCHAKIAELRNGVANVRWPHRHPESEAIAGLRHPATALLNFVENLDRLDDERWMALETTITETYGKPLFVAASRGKLSVDGKPAAGKPSAPAQAKSPAAPSPVTAGEKAGEKKIVVDKTPQRPAPPVAPPPAVAPAQMASPVTQERRPQPQVVPVASSPVTPSTPPSMTTSPVPTASAGPAPAPIHSAPSVTPPVAQQPLAPAPSAPAAAVPPAPVAAPPAPAVSAPAVSNAIPQAAPPAAAVHSLSNLANATDIPEKRPAGPPADAADRQRREPRLATSGPQTLSKPEPKPLEDPETAQQGIAGDGSQRPQRWGFWRGNR